MIECNPLSVKREDHKRALAADLNGGKPYRDHVGVECGGFADLIRRAARRQVVDLDSPVVLPPMMTPGPFGGPPILSRSIGQTI